MLDRDWFEGRLARVTPLRLILTQTIPTASGIVFLVANLRMGQTGWAVVFASILLLEVAVVVWWARVRTLRRRDAVAFRGISPRAPFR